MAKRLVFSTATPNDQGGIIPNESIDFSRYDKNTVLLKEHRWGSDPLGVMTDIRLVGGKYSGIPVFHLETQESREAAGMYAKDAYNAASIGGEALWKKNPVTSDYYRDEQGLKLCEKFFLYEISLVGLPSNEDAVGEETALNAAMVYEDADIYEQMESTILTLSSKFKTMAETKKETATEAGKTETEKVTATAAEAKTEAEKATLATDALPGVIANIIKAGGSVTFSAPSVAAGAVPAAKDEPEATQGEKETGDPQPDPIGLQAKAAQLKAKFQRLIQKADKTVNAALEAKTKAEADDATEEMKATYSALTLDASKDCEAAEKAEEDYNAAQDDADEEEKAKKEKKGAKTTNAAHRPGTTGVDNTPKIKTSMEVRESLKLASAPSFKAKVGADSQGVTFTRLNSSKADEKDKKILRDVFNADKTKTTVDIGAHAIVLNSIMNDPRLKAVVAKTRLMTGVTESAMMAMMNDPMAKRGTSLKQIAAEVNSGRVEYLDAKSGGMKELTLLNSTDNALASPALTTIEWLSLAIFELFPTTTWKANIPMFAAQMMSRNTGIILTNVTANPAIYKGTSPAPAADYAYTDTAVSLALTPYWLQPMLWNPLYMHQLRYDQMATGWAQAFAKWNSVMDDNLIYTLASTVPAGAITPTSGISGYLAAPQVFNIPASGAANSFYWNPNFAGNLLYPTLNDVIAMEQVYRNQNFDLEREKAVQILDPIMERYISQDPELKSLLTRFISANGEEFMGYKHTTFDFRSRVAVYDPATGQVKDINAAIPPTAVSAGLNFIPSQIGMGIGMLDVFMVQDPNNYGYRMSADIRIGAVPLRYNFKGTGLYTYGTGNV